MAFNEKHLRALDPVQAGGRRVKRHHVSIEPGIEDSIQQAAVWA